ncbi:hypothetical protein N665_0176s0035 [Sinapis alba]|nr:hypothetical protein N665_0176s0035 [Sinapis alba]
MDSKETHQQQNHNAAALADPTSTSQAMHNHSSVGDLSLRLRPPEPQPQPEPLTLDASPSSVAAQQRWMQLGMEQRARGRPRKDAPDVIDGGDSVGGADAGPPAKRGRLGRPPGSRNKQQRKALGAGAGGEGGSVTAHVINVNAGEDIAKKLLAFMSQEPRDVCILSALGDVSSAVIKSKTPIRLITYEGQYVITAMSGIFSNTESNDGTVTRTGNLKVSLAGPDFEVVGGCVGGTLVAGSQVQVVVGSFGPERVKLSAASSAPANVLSLSVGGGPGFPQSQAPECSSKSSEENASKSPLRQVGNSTP